MRLYQLSNSFTRPNDSTAYTGNDLIANSTTAANVVPLTYILPSGFLLTKIKLITSLGASNGSLAVHFFSQNPVPALTNGDNGTFLMSADTGYLGNLAMDTTQVTFGTVHEGFTLVDPMSFLLFPDTTPGFENTIYVLIQTLINKASTANDQFTLILNGID